MMKGQKTYVFEAREEEHATWELPKTHMIRQGIGEQVSQILTQFENSTFTSISMFL